MRDRNPKKGRRLRMVGPWSNEELATLTMFKDVLVELLRQGECLCWFVTVDRANVPEELEV
jgi:hypothetical protein